MLEIILVNTSDYGVYVRPRVYKLRLSQYALECCCHRKNTLRLHFVAAWATVSTYNGRLLDRFAGSSLARLGKLSSGDAGMTSSRLTIVLTLSLCFVAAGLTVPGAAVADECNSACQIERVTCIRNAVNDRSACRHRCSDDSSDEQATGHACRRACAAVLGKARADCHKHVVLCQSQCGEASADQGCLGECRDQLFTCGEAFHSCSQGCAAAALPGSSRPSVKAPPFVPSSD